MAAATIPQTVTEVTDLPKGAVTYRHLSAGREVVYSKAHPVLDRSPAWVRVDLVDPRSDRVDDILTEVGDDPEKATAALALEQAKASPRKTLVTKLEAVASTGSA